MTDIDIDFATNTRALKGLQFVQATQTVKDQRKRHPTGVYFQDIPVDPVDGMAVWDYEEAAERGYFKIDLLNNSIYKGVRDEAHLLRLLATEPDWDRLLDPEISAKLAHVNRVPELVREMRPRSIMDLAVLLAVTRPAKRHLMGKHRDEIDREIWLPVQTKQYAYKKPHAIAFAASVVVQLNLLLERRNDL